MATAEQVQYHYDIDTRFFEFFLDTKYRAYSCAVWESASNLEAAQANKLQRLAEFARIRQDDRVLDIGCGWGSMLEYATSAIGAREAVGLTLSREQYAFLIAQGSPNTKISLSSWSNYMSDELFDAIVSIGAFEHFASREDRIAGCHHRIYRSFFEKCSGLTKRGSHIGLQTIVATRTPHNRQELQDARYLLEYVFPGSALPTIDDIQRAMNGLYEIRDLRTIGPDYARTLIAWKQRLEANEGAIVCRYGRYLYEHHRQYFEAAKRNFESGVTDVLQVSLYKLPVVFDRFRRAFRAR